MAFEKVYKTRPNNDHITSNEPFFKPRVQLLKQDKGSETKPKLTEAERTELRIATGNRIDKAYASYINAAEEVKGEVHSAVQAERDFAMFLIDIALGYLLPSASKALANWADKIPNNASNAEFRLAYSLLDSSTISKHLTSASKVGTKAFKDNFTKLSNLSKIDVFIDKLKVQTLHSFDKVDGNLTTLSNEALASVYLAFSTELVNTESYKVSIRKIVKRFKNQILTIGKTKTTNTTVPQSQTEAKTGVQWIEYKPNKLVLANVTFTNKSELTGGGPKSTIVTFNSLIDNDLGPLAEKVGNAEQPNGVRQMKYSGIVEMKQLGLIKNYPKSFPSNKYYKSTN